MATIVSEPPSAPSGGTLSCRVNDSDVEISLDESGLTLLDVSNCDIEIIGDNYLGTLPLLREFRASNNRRLAYIPDVIGTCTNIQRLFLQGCALSSLPYTVRPPILFLSSATCCCLVALLPFGLFSF